MKNLYIIVLLLFLGYSGFAQEEEEDKFDMSVSLNSDVFFGFYPFFAGSYGEGPLDFTFYGILWSGGAAGGAWGNWTEFGVGVGYELSDAIYISPQFGILNGGLTSGLGTPVLFEGVVPNLTVGLGTDKLEGELYAGYYLGIDHGNPSTNNYLHYWLTFGYNVLDFMSLGLHYEQLDYTGGNNAPEDAGYSFYQALGPYIKFSDPNGGAFAKFTTGFDMRSDEAVIESGNYRQPSFFKVSVGYGL